MNPHELQEVRATPLFAQLTNEQIGCLDGGEIIEIPAGHVLAAQGEKTGVFHLLLEGELRVARLYDRQSILMAVIKPGHYIGEIMLLLDIPWLSSVRASKPARLFRMDE